MSEPTFLVEVYVNYDCDVHVSPGVLVLAPESIYLYPMFQALVDLRFRCVWPPARQKLHACDKGMLRCEALGKAG